MEWEVHKYYITSGKWTITKCYIKDQALYTLWKNKRIIEVFDSADEAKRAIDELTN